MSYNERLEDLIDHYFIDNQDLEKKKQMGGVGYLVNGNMCIGIFNDLLIIRAGSSLAHALVKKEGIEHFEQSEESLEGFISVAPQIYMHDKALHKFLSHALEFTSALPPKKHDSTDFSADDPDLN